VAQLVSRRGPRPLDVLTVADLLSRNAPVPAKILYSEPAPAVSVDSLLRREGLAGKDAEAPSNGLARRGAIVAGTLVAAGSVFGIAVATDVSLIAPAPTESSLPEPAVPVDSSTFASGAGVLIDRAAATPGELDAGTAASVSWSEVAFPAAGTRSGGAAARPVAPDRAPTAPVIAAATVATPPTAAAAPAAAAPAAALQPAAGKRPFDEQRGGGRGTGGRPEVPRLDER
jgi:hypothetical protein